MPTPSARCTGLGLALALLVSAPAMAQRPGPMLPGANIAQEGDLYVEFLDGQQFLTFYTLSSVTRTNAGPWFPKAGEVYVIGDNRNNRRD